jgi:ketosteroid isomerase-like protein
MLEESATPDLEVLVRQAYDSFNRGGVEPLLGLVAPNIVLDTDGPGRFEGKDSFRCCLMDWQEAFDEFAVEVEEAVDLGGGVAFVVLEQTGRPKGTSVQVRLRYANVGIMVDGEATHFTQSPDIDEARAAAERPAQARG